MNSHELNNLSKQIHSPVPFWFLNGRVEEWQIVREFEMMREKGISEVIVHPRYGLEVEYLSDDWFQIFGWCVREAKRLGMFVWIYDELNWPSGTAGMRVQQVNPNYRGKYLAVEQRPLDEIDLNTFQPGLCVIAANVEGGSVTKTRLLGNVNDLSALTGDWRIFNCSLHYDQYYIDTMSRDAVDCFKRLTYDEYYRRFGEEFGKTVRAAFTDEPSIYWVSVGYDDWNLPYTDDYFQTFETRHGYDCRPLIPYLFFPGRDAAAFRADYWEHAGFLFNERYHGNLGAWCREHGIIYTGHNNHEEPLRYQIRFQGDMFSTMRAMDIPGVDHLGKQTLGNNWISIIGHKICSSQAHTSGKARAMSESFGVMDWDTTYTHLKRVTDWQYALGINLLVPHALYHTISGTTKRESPPSFFYQSPHWEDFGYFSDYVKRLEEMLCGGRHICKVAVMYPTSGLWSSYQTDRKTGEFDHTDNFLNSLCLDLVRNQVDFDLVDFLALKEASVADGKIGLADEQYEFLIIPSTPYLRPDEKTRIEELVAAGVNTTFFHRSMEPIKYNLPDGLRGATFVRSEELQAFVNILKKQIDHDVQITGGGAEDIMAYRREKDGRKITFLVNRSDKHRKVMAMLKDYPDAAIFDQETGAYTCVEGRQAGAKTQVQIRFQPNQSHFLVSGVKNGTPTRELAGEPEPIELKNLTLDIPYNVASIYHFQYTREQHAGGGEPVQVDVRTDPRHIPVNWSSHEPDYEQYAGAYESDIEIDCDPSNIRLVLDKDYADCDIYFNGTLADVMPCIRGYQPSTLNHQPFLTDFQDVGAFVGHLLKRGMNQLKVISPTKLSEPLRLVGDFHVRLKGKSIVLVEPVQPNLLNLELDYPFYSGTVTYHAEFETQAECSSLILDLHDVHDSATVYLNGELVSKRLWAPYTFDLAGLVRPGANELIVEIRNNMTNMIQGTPRPLGLRSMPTLALI